VNQRGNFVKTKFCCVATALLVAAGMTPTFAQQGRGVVNDWSNRHVIFSNPGSEMDALMHGRRQEWQNFVNSPRYRAQQLRRSSAWTNRFAAAESAFSESHRGFEQGPRFGGDKTNLMQRDWAVSTGSAGNGTALGMFPAEYGVDFSTANCGDYVAFPVNATGSSTQPNLVVFNNLYKTTCNSGTPTVQSAYYLASTGSGFSTVSRTVQTSPVISEDGTKVAFVDTATSFSGSAGSTFYVLTLGSSGSVAHPVQVTSSNAKIIALSGSGSVTLSSPFVDYTNDVAYIGDNAGKVHKFTGVFKGTTPAEVTTGGWPFAVTTSTVLTGPVLDSTSGNIYVGSGGGNIYCIKSATPAACSTTHVAVGDTSHGSTAVLDAPIVVSNGTTGWVFSQVISNNGGSGTTSVVLMQAPISSTTGFGPAVYNSNLGAGNTNLNLHNGDFDNAYYNSSPVSSGGTGYASGHMYFCGTAVYRSSGTNYNEPTLYQVGFAADGTMNSNSATQGPQLVSATHTTGVDCTPLTEVDNGTTDYLFLGVMGHGNPTGCSGQACIMSFNLGSTFGTGLTPTATFPLGGSGSGSSGIVVDNISTTTGASQIYFSNLQNGDATQASQSTLQ
jgi:hypothetical protein